MNDSAVRMFVPEHPAIARTVRGKLERRRAECAEQLAAGLAQDLSDYKHRSGVIRGIDEAIQMCIDTENELNKG